MKCLDKKRIKMKQGESLALNERMMLSSVSNGVSQSKLLTFVSNYKLICNFYKCKYLNIISNFKVYNIKYLFIII